MKSCGNDAEIILLSCHYIVGLKSVSFCEINFVSSIQSNKSAKEKLLGFIDDYERSLREVVVRNDYYKQYRNTYENDWCLLASHYVAFIFPQGMSSRELAWWRW